MHFSKLIRAGIAEPYFKIVKFKRKQTMIIVTLCDMYDSVSLSRFVQLFSRLQRAEGSCSGRVLYSGHSAGTTPATNTHTHTTYLLTYLLTLESRTLAQENTKIRKIGTHCDPAAAYHLLRHVKDDVLADSAGHDVQWYAVACRIES